MSLSPTSRDVASDFEPVTFSGADYVPKDKTGVPVRGNGFSIGTAGTVVVDTWAGQKQVTIPANNLLVGVQHYYGFTKIYSSSTAGSIVVF